LSLDRVRRIFVSQIFNQVIKKYVHGFFMISQFIENMVLHSIKPLLQNNIGNKPVLSISHRFIRKY